MTKLVLNQDEAVAAWLFQVCKCHPSQFNLAIGLANDAGTLIGGIMYTGWNGSDVEVHFYGPGLLKKRIVRLIFWISAIHFNVNRLTVRTRKDYMARGVEKLGAVYEGTSRRVYGPTDDDKHAARQFAFFRERIEVLAGLR